MGLTNSRSGATRAALEERKRREQEITLEDGVLTSPFVVLLHILNDIFTRVRQGSSAA